MLSFSIRRYEFANDVLDVTSTSHTKRYTRVCIQRYEETKFLVAHEETGQTKGVYMCMQVLKRSDSIIQMRQSEPSSVLSANLCSDNNLHLDGWLIIDTNSVMNQREDCSLNGGFNMQVYDKSTFTGVCDGYLGETRLESECLPGEGLNFYFRQAACVPDGLYMYPTQKTYCLANWDDEGFNFILLKHDRMTYMWLFRYPKVRGYDGKFTALLMKDLYASTDSSITATNQYLRLTMSQQISKSLDNLCYDDYEICSVLSDPCSYSDDMARICAKTCGFCSGAKPTVCKLDRAVHGTWIDSNHPDIIPDIQINETALEVASTETLHCIDWTNGTEETKKSHSPENQSDRTEQQMLVTVSDNGCRPRYSCAKYTKMTNVLFMQLSHTRLWPLVESKNDTYHCRNFLYTNNKDKDANLYRTRFPALLLPDKQNRSVDFDLSAFANFEVRFKGGRQCTGHLEQGFLNDSVEFFMNDCEDNSLEDTKFLFVDEALFPFPSLEDDKNNTLLVTKTNHSIPIIHCWLFPKKPNSVFHMVASEDCNGAMKRKISKGRLQPTATFTKTILWTSVTESNTIEEKSANNLESTQNCTDNLLNTSDIVSDGSENSGEVFHSEPTTVSTNKTHNDKSTEADTNSKTASILVVCGVIATVLTVQIGIHCNCSC